MRAVLVLEDGKSFSAQAETAGADKFGEVILNSAVVGYQEMVTDPANAGKILVLSYPLIGNYGCAPKFNESKKVWVEAVVIKEKSAIFSNWQARESFDDFAKKENLTIISGLDTRTLAVHLRGKSGMFGVISTTEFEPKKLLAKITAFKKRKKPSLFPQISVKSVTILGKAKAKKIAVLDLGITNSVLKQLEALGVSVALFPYNTKAAQILEFKPAGLIVSNGPEEDPGLEGLISQLKPLIGKLPILGISTGHQALAAALGAKVVKMKHGHCGVNYPMARPGSFKAEITVQNHSCVVERSSLKKIKGLEITGYNLNDSTVEEIESKRLKLIGAQYYPSSPGLTEINNVFKRFLKIL